MTWGSVRWGHRDIPYKTEENTLVFLKKTHWAKKAIIHQVTTMLAISKNVLFPGHNYLQTTAIDDLTLLLSTEHKLLKAVIFNNSTYQRSLKSENFKTTNMLVPPFPPTGLLFRIIIPCWSKSLPQIHTTDSIPSNNWSLT